jgi:hypothetical protein
MPLTCGDTAPDSWSLSASVQGGSDGRITHSARTLVQRQLPIRGYGHILNLASPRGCRAIAPALTAVRTIRMRGAFPAPCGHDVAQAHHMVARGDTLRKSCSSSMTTSRRPRKSDRSACADAGPRTSGAVAAGDAGGRERAQNGQYDRAAEHGAEITDVVGGDTDADDRDGEA